MPRGRTIVFIDNSNVFHGQRTAGWRIDACLGPELTAALLSA